MNREELKPIELECNMGPDVNRVVHREPWKAYDIDEVNLLLDQYEKEIKILKEFIANGDVNRITWIDGCLEKDAEIESLKAKLENAWATVAFNHLDAVTRERRLKQALWLARAKRASEKQQLFLFSLDFEKLCIDGFFDPYNGRKELSPKQWVKVFNKVENKCRAKAEEYK